MMVVEGATGTVVGDIPNTPGVHPASPPRRGELRALDINEGC